MTLVLNPLTVNLIEIIVTGIISALGFALYWRNRNPPESSAAAKGIAGIGFFFAGFIACCGGLLFLYASLVSG